METNQLILFFILALLAEVLGTLGGFGSSLFFVPIASYFFDFQTVLGITASFHVVSNLTHIAYFRKGFSRKLILEMGIPAVVAVIAGAWLSQFANTEILEFLLGIFLIIISLYFLRWPNHKMNANTQTAVLGGGVSGFLAGIVGTGGAIRGLVLASFQLGKEAFIATSAWIDLGIDMSRSVVYYSNGYIHREVLYLIPALLFASIAGTGLGKWLLNYVSDSQFRRLVLLLIFVIGWVTVGRTVLSIFKPNI